MYLYSLPCIDLPQAGFLVLPSQKAISIIRRTPINDGVLHNTLLQAAKQPFRRASASDSVSGSQVRCHRYWPFWWRFSDRFVSTTGTMRYAKCHITAGLSICTYKFIGSLTRRAFPGVEICTSRFSQRCSGVCAYAYILKSLQNGIKHLSTQDSSCQNLFNISTTIFMLCANRANGIHLASFRTRPLGGLVDALFEKLSSRGLQLARRPSNLILAENPASCPM